MGFMDKIIGKAREAAAAVQGSTAEEAPQEQASPAPQGTPPSQTSGGQDAAISGPSFQWDGDVYPMPSGWDGLSMEEWFLRFETIRERIRHIDDETGLPAMTDEDGDPLDPEEVLLVSEYGFRDGGHFEAYRSWAVADWARQTGESPSNLEARMGKQARDQMHGEKAQGMSGAGGALEPVEGVDVETWARLQAQLASGADLGALLASAGIDGDRWQRVSNEWMSRMSTDTSGTVARVYGEAFAGGGR